MFNYTGMSFIPVSGDKAKMTLGEISANEDCSWSAIQFWTTGGANKRVTVEEFENVKANYTFWADPSWTVAGVAGWYLEADEKAKYPQNNVEIPFGTGFIFCRDGGEAGAQLIYAGQVTSEPTPVGSFASMFNYVSSCCPRDITLGEITANDDCSWSAIQFWTSGGANDRVTVEEFVNVKANYTYWSDPTWTVAGVAGWYLEADEKAKYPQNNIKIDAGKGFIFCRDGGEAGAAISLPAAL